MSLKKVTYQTMGSIIEQYKIQLEPVLEEDLEKEELESVKDGDYGWSAISFYKDGDGDWVYANTALECVQAIVKQKG